jgi:hypothetical protein
MKILEPVIDPENKTLPPDELEFDADEASHHRGVPSFVRWVAESFTGVEGLVETFPIEAWHRLLVHAPDARRDRIQWVRIAGVFRAYAAGLDKYQKRNLFDFLAILPTMPPAMARRMVWRFKNLGIHSSREIADAYYAEGPRQENFVDGHETHGIGKLRGQGGEATRRGRPQ